jgi:hypothetical protein
LRMQVPLDESAAVRARLTIPTTIAPKYIPPTESNTPAAKRLAAIDYDLKPPAPLSFQLTAEMSSRVLSVSSPSHGTLLTTTGGDVALGGTFAAVSKFGGGAGSGPTTADLDRDIVVLVETADVNEAHVVVEQGEGSSVLLLSFVPRFAFKQQATELIFLVDCSGSMEGEGIKLAGEALLLFLHSLPVNAYFNIICFGSSYQRLFPESRRYDDDTLGRAKQLAAGLAANLGGTEIYAPLEAIVTAAPAAADTPRQIFVLTDGQVSNTEACIELMGRYADKNRVFTLGIGSAADRHLVKGLARASHGTAAFTTAGESLAPKVLKQLKNAVQPGVQDFTVDWGVSETAHACQAPGRLPAVYNGTRLQVFRLLSKAAPLPTHVKLAAKVAGAAFSQEIPVTAPASTTSTSLLLHKMFARKMIQDLEENYSNHDGGQKKLTEAEVKELITELGLKFGLASRHTSFIAVDSAAPGKEIPAPMVSRQVANQVAFGYGGFGGGGHRMMACSMPAPAMRMCVADAAPMTGHMMTKSVRSLQSCGLKARRFAPLSAECAVFSDSMPSPSTGDSDDMEECDAVDNDFEQPTAATTTPTTPRDTVLQLTSLQSAQGSFAASPLIADATAKSMGELEAAQPAAAVADSKLWWTALVVELLEEKYPELSDYWLMIVEKAKEWLLSQLGNNATAVESLLTAAKQLVCS